MALDKIHKDVKTALEKEGWKITKDPYLIPSGGINFKIDLESEKVIAAEKNGDRIAVEVKSLVGTSLVYAFYPAFGQYLFYRDALNDEGIDQEVYMAISNVSFIRINRIPFLRKRIKQYNIKFIVVDTYKQKIIKWIN